MPDTCEFVGCSHAGVIYIKLGKVDLGVQQMSRICLCYKHKEWMLPIRKQYRLLEAQLPTCSMLTTFPFLNQLGIDDLAQTIQLRKFFYACFQNNKWKRSFFTQIHKLELVLRHHVVATLKDSGWLCSYDRCRSNATCFIRNDSKYRFCDLHGLQMGMLYYAIKGTRKTLQFASLQPLRFLSDWQLNMDRNAFLKKIAHFRATSNATKTC